MYDSIIGLNVKVKKENIDGKIISVYEDAEDTVFVVEAGREIYKSTINDFNVDMGSIKEKINNLMKQKAFLEEFAAISTY
ncbi:hypothetical protein WKH56_06520 [Priestia sp. SB1]|uniref:Uncharacterized protein n=1 Tax=Priestia aryabhattai TaxID=412384 RepID=A0AAX6NBX0_PRIAR|nr:hypothetical protein [Priestia aryabhattai]MDU9693362.1 hypothetical protein [Priestia aryabhattai]